MQKRRKMIILALLLALVLTGCSPVKQQEVLNTSSLPEQEEPPIVSETVPELSDASERALEAAGTDAAQEAEQPAASHLSRKREHPSTVPLKRNMFPRCAHRKMARR